jgi:hypothetical protein
METLEEEQVGEEGADGVSETKVQATNLELHDSDDDSDVEDTDGVVDAALGGIWKEIQGTDPLDVTGMTDDDLVS